jgi:SAM-dependent methyltransferase
MDGDRRGSEPLLSRVAGPALRRFFRLYEWLRTADRAGEAPAAPDGLPIPPATLRFRVAGTPDVEPFLDGGRLAARTVRELLAASGRPIEQCRAVLDFGCGCGRVLRQWRDLAGTAVFGTDLDPGLIEWCRAHLLFASVAVNLAEPPAPFDAARFDAIYAFSVLTHMPASLQKRWLDEFRRILAPGGLLIFSTHGSYYLPRLGKEERQRFLNGELVVRFAPAAGSNLCNTYHPEAFVRRELAPGWDVAAFQAEGALGNPRQDAWVFRRSG